MQWIEQNWWPLFMSCLFIFLVSGVWLQKIASRFYIQPGNMKFSVFELEWPASEASLALLISLMSADVKTYVRRHLLADFIFMVGCYTGIALLCYKTSTKMTAFGKYIFIALALAQIISWLCDVIENSYLLGRIKKTEVASPDARKESKQYRFIQTVVKTKFVLAFLGAVCSVFGLLYFWVVGDYSKESLPWLGALIFLLLLVTILKKAIMKPKKLQLQ